MLLFWKMVVCEMYSERIKSWEEEEKSKNPFTMQLEKEGT